MALFKQPPLEEDIVPILLYECHRLYHDGITIQVLWKKSFACMKRHCGTPAATTDEEKINVLRLVTSKPSAIEHVTIAMGYMVFH